METSPAVVERLIMGTPPELRRGGIHAEYVAINEDWGIKYFESLYQRDSNYDAQFNSPYSPQLGDKIDFHLGEEPLYGYITENVQVYGDFVVEQYDIKKAEAILNGLTPYSDNFPQLYKVENDLKRTVEPWKSADEELSAHIWEDRHLDNWGITKNGRAVVIDFSCEPGVLRGNVEYDAESYDSDDIDDSGSCHCSSCMRLKGQESSNHSS